MSEERDMMNATLDNGKTSQNKFVFGVSLFLVYQATRLRYKYIKFRLIPNQDLASRFGKVNLASGESRDSTKFDTGMSLKQIFTWC